LLSEYIVPEIPKNVFKKSRMLPDIFIESAVVIEVLGTEITEITESPGHTAGEGNRKKDLHCVFLAFCV